MGIDSIEAPCSEVQSFIEYQKNQTQSHHGINPKFYLGTMYQRYFRCGFKKIFSGALRRVFTGMDAIQHYEVTMMRKYESDHGISFCRTRDSTCFIAEFSLQSKSLGTEISKIILPLSQWSWQKITEWKIIGRFNRGSD